MNKTTLAIIALTCSFISGACGDPKPISPLKSTQKVSPGNTPYYIDPAKGSDSNSGLKEEKAWRTFSRINEMQLSPGDKVKIIAPGSFDQTLMLTGSAAARSPVEITFAPGRYDFYPKDAFRRAYQISNTNGDPDTPKAVGILFDNAKHFKLSGPGANIVFRGKMIEVCVDSSQDILISDLSFDYHRPSVSEYSVAAIGDDYIDLKIHRDSAYTIKDGKILWQCEGWDFGAGLGQELDLSTNEVWRMRSPLGQLTFEELKPYLVRGRGKHSMRKGSIYQVRDPSRDCCGVFTRRSKDIAWKNVHFKFMHGMGIVNQFSENLTFDTVTIAPDKESSRTTAAWADCMQVSGCKGKLLVKDCIFSGAHDDAINIHGTHLRVTEKVGTDRVKVKFIHNQTFGFLAFNPGDEIEFVRWDSLETYAPNKVKDATLLNPMEILLTLEKPYPSGINENDVIENVTWTPEVEIRGCDISRIPTRGFLITTRRKVLVENNTFRRTHMNAILLEDDAAGWFESGCIRDMTIRKNKFINCAEPVVNINPRNTVPNDAVHQNIRVEENEFILRGNSMLRAKSTKGLTITANKIYSAHELNDESAIKTTGCSDVKISKNSYLPLPK